VFQRDAMYETKLFPRKSRSQFEDQIAKYLTKWGVEFQRNKKIIKPYELDFYIESHNLAIEINGLYWHSEIAGKKDKKYHEMKFHMSLEKGIHLLTIFDDEWINQRDQILAHLKYKLKLADRGLPARKLEARVINHEQSLVKRFLDKYHIQGAPYTLGITVGAYDKDFSLVSVMTFSKLDEDVYDLTRFTSDSKTHAGVFSKLLKKFVEVYEPKKIISFSDNRWSNGKLYNSNSFVEVSKVKPAYFYTDYEIKIHRFNMRKGNIEKKYGIDMSTLTEREATLLLGFDKVWDCGKIKWEWTKT